MGDIHKYLNGDFKHTLECLEQIDKEIDGLPENDVDLAPYENLMNSAKYMLLYKLKSNYNTLKLGYDLELEIPEKYSTEFKNILDPVLVDSEGELKLVGRDGNIEKASMVKFMVENYAKSQKAEIKPKEEE